MIFFQPEIRERRIINSNTFLRWNYIAGAFASAAVLGSWRRSVQAGGFAAIAFSEYLFMLIYMFDLAVSFSKLVFLFGKFNQQNTFDYVEENRKSKF